MKRIRLFHNELEARMSRDLLASNGIEAQVIGAKEYVSHVIGGGLGNYELLVDPNDEVKAEKILKSVEVNVASQPESESKTESDSKPAPDYYGRAIFYACAAWVILPIIFNYASITNALTYWKNSKKDGTAKTKMAAIFILQIPTAGMIYFLFGSYTGKF